MIQNSYEPLARRFGSLVIILSGVAGLAGCVGPVLSSSDRLAVKQAEQLHLMLSPVVVEAQSARLRTYFTQVGGRIAAAAKESGPPPGGIDGPPPGWWSAGDIRFHLVADDVPNAFTVSGSHVYLSTALLARCTGEDDMAAALCHALAHAYAARQLAGPVTPVDVTRDVISLSRPPALENAIDPIGFDLFARAGWEPSRYTGLLPNTAARPGTAPVPLPPERLKRLMDGLPARADEWRQPPVADARRFADLQAEARSVANAIPRTTQATLLIEAVPNCFLPEDPPEVARARAELSPPPATGDNPWGKGPRPRPAP